MDKEMVFVGVVIICVVNGIFSPAIQAVVVLAPIWYPALIVPFDIQIVFYLSTLVVSTLTLLLSGIPAAIYERVTGLEESDTVSTLIWFAGAALLSIPGFLRVLPYL